MGVISNFIRHVAKKAITTGLIQEDGPISTPKKTRMGQCELKVRTRGQVQGRGNSANQSSPLTLQILNYNTKGNDIV